MKIISLFILLIPSICFGGQFRTNQSSGTVGQFHFNELSGTESENETQGFGGMSLKNGAIFASGRYGNGIYLDGVNDYANASTQFMNRDLNSLTVAFSFNFTSNTNQCRLVDGGHFQYFAIDADAGWSGNKMLFIWLAKADDYACNWVFPDGNSVAKKFFDGKWHRLVYTFNNPRAFSLYFDGEKVVETGIVTAGKTNALSATVGFGTGVNYFQKGVIDEFLYLQDTAWEQGVVKKDYFDFKGRHNDLQEN